MRHTSRSVEVDPLWLALGVLDLLDLDLLPMQLVHVGDHIHTLHTGQRGQRGRATPHPHISYTPWPAHAPATRGLLGSARAFCLLTCPPIHYLSTYLLPVYLPTLRLSMARLDVHEHEGGHGVLVELERRVERARRRARVDEELAFCSGVGRGVGRGVGCGVGRGVGLASQFGLG